MVQFPVLWAIVVQRGDASRAGGLGEKKWLLRNGQILKLLKTML